MAKEGYRPPRIRTIALGIAIFVLFLIAVCSLSQGVKWAGSALLFLPERLGLVRTARPAEIFTFDISHSPSQVEFARAGLYQVYTSDYDLLVISDQLAKADAPPWVTVTGAQGGAPVPVSHITRGLLPYDTPYAPGRPVIEVDIPEPGKYVLDYPTRRAVISMVPDYVTGHEALITICYAVQLLILVLPVALLLYRRELRLLRITHEKRVRSIEKFEKIRRLARGQRAEGNGGSESPKGP